MNKMLLTLPILLVTLLLILISDEVEGAGDDWPAFRHDSANSGVSTSPVPNGIELNWSFTMGGYISSQIVAEDKVFLSGMSENDTVYHLALNYSTGQVVWSKELEIPNVYRPVYGNGYVYYSDGYDVVAYNASTGETVWRYEAQGYTGWFTIENDLLIFADTSYNLYAVYAANGTEIWNHTIPDMATSIIIYNNTIFYGTWDHNLTADYLPNGSRRWSTSVGPIATVRYIAASDNVILTSEYSYGWLLAFNQITGEEIWRYWQGETREDMAVTADGYVYFTTQSKLIALDVKTGEVILNVEAIDTDSGRGALGRPSISGDTICFYRIYPKTIQCNNRFTGEKLWAYETGSFFMQKELILANGWIFAMNSSTLQAFSPAPGGSGPDIKVEEISSSHDYIIDGWTISITSKLFNDSPNNATSGNLTFYYDSVEEANVIQRMTFGEIPARNFLSLSVPWNTTGMVGPRRIYAVVSDVVPEENVLSNNIGFKRLSIQLNVTKPKYPDLAIYSAVPSSESLIQGQQLNLNVTLINEGNKAVREGNLTVFIGSPEQNISVFKVGLNEIQPATFSSYAFELDTENLSGNLTLFFVISFVKPAESDTTNNIANLTLFITPRKVDFSITADNLSYRPLSPQAGENVTLRAKIGFNGNVEASARIDFYVSIDGVESLVNSTTITVNPLILDIEYIDVVSYNWTPTKGGNYTYRVVVESELDQSPQNNRAQISFTIIEEKTPSNNDSDTNGISFMPFIVVLGIIVSVIVVVIFVKRR